MSAERAKEIADALRADIELVPVQLLEAIGIVCWGPQVDDREVLELSGADRPYYLEVQEIAARVRTFASDLGPIEWSPVTYGGEQLGADPRVVPTGSFDTECLRTVTRALLENPDQVMASLPSFPAPFGPGWQPNPGTALCGAGSNTNAAVPSLGELSAINP